MAKSIAHGVVGGISSIALVGKFKDGFMGSFASQGFEQLGGYTKLGLNKNVSGAGQRLKNVIASAVIGGTASTIGGGKFSNGAVSGAFSRMFNDLAIGISDKEFEEGMPRTKEEAENQYEGIDKRMAEDKSRLQNVALIGDLGDQMIMVSGPIAATGVVVPGASIFGGGLAIGGLTLRAFTGRPFTMMDTLSTSVDMVGGRIPNKTVGSFFEIVQPATTTKQIICQTC